MWFQTGFQNNGIGTVVGVTMTMTTKTIEEAAVKASMSREMTTRVVAAVVARAANHLVCMLRRQTYRVQSCSKRRRRQRLLDASDDATRDKAL